MAFRRIVDAPGGIDCMKVFRAQSGLDQRVRAINARIKYADRRNVIARPRDAPGKIVSSVKMAVAAATGNRPDMGENRKVAM